MIFHSDNEGAQFWWCQLGLICIGVGFHHITIQYFPLPIQRFEHFPLPIQRFEHFPLPIQRFEGTEWSESTKCRYWPREARYVLPEDRCWKEVGLVHLLTSTFVVCGTNTVEVTNLEGRVFCIQYCSLVSWPACTCLPARNDLVNKVKFLGLISQNQWDCEIANYYVALPLQHY